MKRSVKSSLRFLLLVLCTIFTTVIVFYRLRPPKGHKFDSFSNQAALPVEPHKLSRRKIDWHNYEQMNKDLARTGKSFLFMSLEKNFCSKFSRYLLLNFER